jgi:hypothetical protein
MAIFATRDLMKQFKRAMKPRHGTAPSTQDANYHSGIEESDYMAMMRFVCSNEMEGLKRVRNLMI